MCREIQSTTCLELNVRCWTPGVEPCAETKSSRHCHLGRDSRIFTPAGEPPFFYVPRPRIPSQPSPTLPPPPASSSREATRTANVRPSRAILRTLSRRRKRQQRETIFLAICLFFRRSPFVGRVDQRRAAKNDTGREPLCSH